MNILLIGHGAREHVIAETFRKNKEVKIKVNESQLTPIKIKSN